MVWVDCVMCKGVRLKRIREALWICEGCKTEYIGCEEDMIKKNVDSRS